MAKVYFFIFFKWVTTLLPFIVGCYLFVDSLMHSRYLSGFTYLLVGSGVAFFVGISWYCQEFRIGGTKIYFYIVTAIGVFAVLYESPFLKKDDVNISTELTNSFAEIPIYCGGNSALIGEGVLHCGAKPLYQALDFENQLMKAIHLGPVTSLIDGVYSASQDEKVDKCLVNYIAAQKLCPDAFILVERKYPELKEFRGNKKF